MGALIHGYVPEDLMASIMAADAWWSVPAAVAMGIPMYTNAAGVIPIVEALQGPGCKRSETAASMAANAATARGLDVAVEKVSGPRAIAMAGVMATPGISIDGKLVHAGGLRDKATLGGWLTA